jgi:hypothetical protein
MKQRITLTQFNRLNKKQKEKIIKWSRTCKSFMDEIQEGGYDPNYILLNIGEMIEFIIDNERKECDIFIERVIKWRFEGDHGIIWGSERGTLEYDELCDALWEAVKVVLNET